jgi:hypothetical protein
MIERELTQLVSSVGFPIAAFLLMWRTHVTTLAKMTEALNKLREVVVAYHGN